MDIPGYLAPSFRQVSAPHNEEQMKYWTWPPKLVVCLLNNNNFSMAGSLSLCIYIYI